MARPFDPVHLGSPQFRTRERGPFLISDVRFPPGLTLPLHEHERAVVAVTLGGAWDSVMRGRAYPCAPGTLLVEPAGERHSNHFSPIGGRVVIAQPDLAARDAFEPCAASLGRPMSFACAPAAMLAHRVAREIDEPDSLSSLALDALALELMVLTGRAAREASRGTRPPAWLARAVDYLHAHRFDRIALAAVAAAAGVHPAHLSREFRRHHHTSVAAYVRALRLSWAADRLAATPCAIASIAADAGFADQSHFTRAFRRHTGLTPLQFRLNAGGSSVATAAR